MPKKDWFAPHAYFHRHRNAFRTNSVMQRLRANLSSEQRALAELDSLVYTRLLNELQTATCLMATFPRPCDALSLLNAVAAESNVSAAHDRL